MPAILPVLFGDGILTEEVDLSDPLGKDSRDAELSELLPEEAAGLSRAAPGRLREFRAGRHCARAVLGRFGVQGLPVTRAPDRSPVWPDGFVGSISHTRSQGRGFCGAAVARAGEARSIGLDIELDEPLDRKLWERIFTSSELAWIETVPEAEQGYLGKLVFSVKECAYKCQYPLSHQFLEFADVTVTVSEEREETFTTLLRDAGPLQKGTVLAGRFTRRDGIIATGVTLLFP